MDFVPNCPLTDCKCTEYHCASLSPSLYPPKVRSVRERVERKKHRGNHTAARLPLLWLGPIFFSTPGEVRLETPSARAPQRDKVQAWLLAPKAPQEGTPEKTDIQIGHFSASLLLAFRGKERVYSRPQL